MKRTTIKLALSSCVLTLTVALAACGDDEVIMPEPRPTMDPPMDTTFDVSPCLSQQIPGTGFTVAEAILPDTLTINLAAASGFPNGRRLEDPVVDVTLGVIFLDLATHSPALFAQLPLNPSGNDVPLRTEFPFLAPPRRDSVSTTQIGTEFTFNEMREFVRVDRMGMPAVATALIGSDRRNDYNDADPINDANGDFVDDLAGTLTALTNALADDLVALDLTPCATPVT